MSNPKAKTIYVRFTEGLNNYWFALSPEEAKALKKDLGKALNKKVLTKT